MENVLRGGEAAGSGETAGGGEAAGGGNEGFRSHPEEFEGGEAVLITAAAGQISGKETPPSATKDELEENISEIWKLNEKTGGSVMVISATSGGYLQGDEATIQINGFYAET